MELPEELVLSDNSLNLCSVWYSEWSLSKSKLESGSKSLERVRLLLPGVSGLNLRLDKRVSSNFIGPLASS